MLFSCSADDPDAKLGLASNLTRENAALSPVPGSLPQVPAPLAASMLMPLTYQFAAPMRQVPSHPYLPNRGHDLLLRAARAIP
jgi:hypothetical protein